MKRRFSGVSFYLVLLLMLLMAYRFISPPRQAVPEMDYNTMVTSIQNGDVKSIEIHNRIVRGVTKEDKSFQSIIPEGAEDSFYNKYVQPQVEKASLKVTGIPEETTSKWISILPSLLLVGVMIFFWFVFMQNAQGGGGGRMMNFGKSKAKQLKDDEMNNVTFADVAGLHEEKEELEEIVDFLKNPRKFVKMGARIPKGVLMVGPPGTGKTYLSKAVAGEAKVPFFTISGSDFVEMFVGVGASRVRDLFQNAKKMAPCIIFIDEIDAVGRIRGAGVGGGHDEREQTLNQLLVEMDGFGTNEGVIVMAATNRADILDPALLRPGRFDRTVTVGRPDIRGREEILNIHARKKPLAQDVDLKVVAKRTPGFTPADLENLMNEAALLAARFNKSSIDMDDIEEASIKVQAGPAKKSKVVSEKERKLTAVHEAGHAVVSRLLPNHDPVHMITIIPRGAAGGFTAYLPDEDQSFMTKGQMEEHLVSLLGGRVAESLVLDDISTGASNDIERATKIARAMVTQYGMTKELGTITYGTDDEQVFMGRDFSRGRHFSDETASMIDRQVRAIIDHAYTTCENLLKENMDKLLRVSEALLERETINRKEFEDLFLGQAQPSYDPDKGDIFKEEDISERAKEALKESEKKSADKLAGEDNKED